jgi:SWI/SNF-related matrix-associated actin-dependent regulator of chromatin subfamily A3
VVFKHPNELSAAVDGDSVSLEISSPPACKALGDMVLREEITLQLYCHLETGFQASHRAQGNRKQRTAQLLFLRAIIYGRAEVGDAVGQFLSSKMLYLQDPINCDRDVIYQNPHNLSRPDKSPVMTGAFRYALENLEIERLDVGPGLLARLLEGEIPFQESAAPAGVVTSLCRYMSLPQCSWFYFLKFPC